MITLSDWVEFAASGIVVVLVCCLLYFAGEMLRVWRRLREIEREEEEGFQG